MKIDYKALFVRAWSLIVRPRQTWEEIMQESPRKEVGTTFVWPLICLCGMAVLIGGVIRDGFADGAFWETMADSCIQCVVLFDSFYFVAWGLNMLRVRYQKADDDMPLCTLFAGYAMVVVFALALLTALFPSLLLFKLVLQFYVVYIVWQGADLVLGVDEERRMTFSLVASAIILLVPFILQFIFDKLSLLLA